LARLFFDIYQLLEWIYDEELDYRNDSMVSHVTGSSAEATRRYQPFKTVNQRNMKQRNMISQSHATASPSAAALPKGDRRSLV